LILRLLENFTILLACRICVSGKAPYIYSFHRTAEALWYPGKLGRITELFTASTIAEAIFSGFSALNIPDPQKHIAQDASWGLRLLVWLFSLLQSSQQKPLNVVRSFTKFNGSFNFSATAIIPLPLCLLIPHCPLWHAYADASFTSPVPLRLLSYHGTLHWSSKCSPRSRAPQTKGIGEFVLSIWYISSAGREDLNSISMSAEPSLSRLKKCPYQLLGHHRYGQDSIKLPRWPADQPSGNTGLLFLYRAGLVQRHNSHSPAFSAILCFFRVCCESHNYGRLFASLQTRFKSSVPCLRFSSCITS